jgi:hypothetical protein
MCGFDSEVEGKQKTDAIKQAVHNKRKGSKRKDTTFHAGYLHFFMSCGLFFTHNPLTSTHVFYVARDDVPLTAQEEEKLEELREEERSILEGASAVRQKSWPCGFGSCKKVCNTPWGLDRHRRSKHPTYADDNAAETKEAAIEIADYLGVPDDTRGAASSSFRKRKRIYVSSEEENSDEDEGGMRSALPSFDDDSDEEDLEPPVDFTVATAR